jgi:DDE_Tnp_1-associated
MDLLSILATIPDHRDRQGREYRLEHILLFSILALLSNAKGYSDIERFITAHFEKLKSIFKLKWRRVPHLSAIRKIIVGINPVAIEQAFQRAAAAQDKLAQEKNFSTKDRKHLCFDGKSLNGSFSQVHDKRALHVFQVFAAHSQIILAHVPLGDKESEIPAFQELLMTLDLKGCLVTADALHCQKKLSSAQNMRELT